MLSDGGDEVPEFHVDVADVLHGGEDGGEGGQLVCQARLVPAVYGLADPVLPQLDVDHVEAAAQHAAHHGLAVLPHQAHQPLHPPLAVDTDSLHQSELSPQLGQQPGAACPAERPHLQGVTISRYSDTTYTRTPGQRPYMSVLDILCLI